MNEKNPYENLRHPGIDDTVVMLITPYKVIDIYKSEQEEIQILIAHSMQNHYTFGYRISFKSGRKADRTPSLESGWFNNTEEAVLYFLGLIISCKQWFSPELIIEVRKLCVEYGQTKLL